MNANGTMVDEKYTSQLAAWRASQRHQMTLPQSGLEVELKRVSLEDLVINGGIPDTLSGLVTDLLDGGKEFKVTGSNLNVLVGVFNVVVMACVVSPPVAARADDTHLGIDEIPFADKQAIFDWANGDAKALRPFRSQQGEPGNTDAPAPVGEGVQHTAVGNSGHPE